MKVRTGLLILGGTMSVLAIVQASSRQWLSAVSMLLGAATMLGLYLARGGRRDEASIVDEVRRASGLRKVSAGLVLVFVLGSIAVWRIRAGA